MALALLPVGCREPRPPRPDILIVLLDTLRADGLSVYGNPRPTSPHMDRLAESAVLFERAYAQAPNTATSHATLFTGLEPWVHRVANITSLRYGTPGLDDSFVTLAERLFGVGYRTAAITDDGPLGRGWNLMQGFAELDADLEGIRAKVDKALAFFESAEVGGPPLFLFLHTYQVHQPFAPPPAFVERFDPGYEGVLKPRVEHLRALRARGEDPNNGLLLLEGIEAFSERDLHHLRALYDGEIAFTDHHLARLWQALDEAGRLDPMGIAITSDHGEEFGEHGRYGHYQLHDETLRIPLILKLPHGRHGGRRVDAPVSLADLNPTLLELADAAPIPGSRASSLLGPLESGAWPQRALLAQTTEQLYEPLRSKPAWASLRLGDSALLTERHSRDGVPGTGPWMVRLYDLSTDPGELHPVATRGWDEPQGSASARSQLEDLLRRLESELAALETTRFDLLRGRHSEVLPGSAELERLHGALGYR